MINRIRDIRRQKGWTLADLAAACAPPTTAQTIGRLETGTRNLSLKWMERIAAALDVDPQMLVRSEGEQTVAIVAMLDEDGPHALETPREAVQPGDLGTADTRMVMQVSASTGAYRAGDQLWLQQITPEEAHRAINRDVLVPRRAGRFAFGRLVDSEPGRIALLPPEPGRKQLIVEDPAWLAVAQTLVRPL
ncbi:MAG: helix-turn-helix transcriptional regulator [Erythrobacter sp.]|nr:helix-turn-helix transcriptional regulator [Erythrobacter sp.]NCQ62628.1 helix-turn-helix transcriptional regulator [Alphaproteobacteria bacterium]